MIAALWANPNWDDTKDTQDKGGRKRAIEGINEDYAEAIETIELAFTTRPVPEEEKLSDDNPFFAAADRGLAKVDQRIQGLKDKGQEIKKDDPVDYMRDVDQN